MRCLSASTARHIMVNFIFYGRSQAFLLTPDLRDWIGVDDLAHFVTGTVERVDIGGFKVNWRGHGKAQYHPRMMLALLIYCYANGIFRRTGLSVPRIAMWRCATSRRILTRTTTPPPRPNIACGSPGGCSSQAARTTMLGFRISVSSPLLGDYDDPEILRYSIPPICLIGADEGHIDQYNNRRLP